MDANLAALLYLVSGVLFIMALRGLSSPESSRRGNQYGMIGMGIAVATTLAVAAPSDVMTWGLILLGVAVGGTIGAITANRIAMTQMPQLVAAFHSLVGLAAVFVAALGVGISLRAKSSHRATMGAILAAIVFSGSYPLMRHIQLHTRWRPGGWCAAENAVRSKTPPSPAPHHPAR